MDINKKIETIEKKIDKIINLLDGDVKQNCNKMGEHIEFIENIYDRVKNPLGFICNRINNINNLNTPIITLEDKKIINTKKLKIEPKTNNYIYIVGCTVTSGIILKYYFK